MKIDYEEVQQMIEDCQARESKLSEWEQGFIDSIDSQLGNGNGISEKQYEKLSDIWERVT